MANSSLDEPLTVPSNEQIAELQPFEKLGLESIQLIADPSAADRAFSEIIRHNVIGFDTEARPTFRVGEISQGPHVVQFAAAECAWVFVLHDSACIRVVAKLLAAPELIKVGFGLEGDRSQITRKLGVPPQGVIDLNTLFRRLGYPRSLGAKRAVAVVFQQRFRKSGRMTTSNWSVPVLSTGQIAYAANDAWVAMRVYQAMGISLEMLKECGHEQEIRPQTRPGQPRRHYPFRQRNG